MLNSALSILGGKAASVLAIIGVAGALSAYTNNMMSSYATVSDLNLHIADFSRYERNGIEDAIRAVENEIQILEVETMLTPREKLRLRQLRNEKEYLLRKSQKLAR